MLVFLFSDHFDQDVLFPSWLRLVCVVFPDIVFEGVSHHLLIRCPTMMK